MCESFPVGGGSVIVVKFLHYLPTPIIAPSPALFFMRQELNKSL